MAERAIFAFVYFLLLKLSLLCLKSTSTPLIYGIHREFFDNNFLLLLLLLFKKIYILILPQQFIHREFFDKKYHFKKKIIHNIFIRALMTTFCNYG
jgi:uncharacterized membrane protein